MGAVRSASRGKINQQGGAHNHLAKNPDEEDEGKRHSKRRQESMVCVEEMANKDGVEGKLRQGRTSVKV